MNDDSRDTPWRQGDLFELTTGDGDTVTGVVATHDCDLYAPSTAEPNVEFVTVEYIAKSDGRMSFGKNPRRLHCTVKDGENTSVVQLNMLSRQAISKDEFSKLAKQSSYAMSDPDRRIFRGWLAARYSRSAFPNSFEARLPERLIKKIEKLSGERGHDIRALYFDLDDGQMVERGEGECYELEIWAVYEGQVADPTEAETFAHDLGVLFREEYLNTETQEWEGDWQRLQ